MTLFADGEVWNNMAAMIVASGTLLAVILNWVTNMFTAWLSHRNQMALKEDLKENTKETKSIVPVIETKVDSATKKAEQATDKAEKITEIAAAKVGVLIGKVLGDKADQAAEKVATVALKASEAMASTVDKIATAIKGTDGTCISSRVEEHGKQLETLYGRVGQVETDVGEVRKDTRQILDLLQTTERK